MPEITIPYSEKLEYEIYHKNNFKFKSFEEYQNREHQLTIYCPYTLHKIITCYTDDDGSSNWWTIEDHSIVWLWLIDNSKTRARQYFIDDIDSQVDTMNTRPRAIYKDIINYYFDHL